MLEMLNIPSFRKITPDSEYYRQAVQLRYEVFFQPQGTSIDMLFDELESSSIHVAVIANDLLVGYARISLYDEAARVSQVVIKKGFRGVWRIWHNLYKFICDEAIAHSKKKLVADARLTSVNLYKRIGFVEVGSPFPSKKTGIMHVAMEKIL